MVFRHPPVYKTGALPIELLRHVRTLLLQLNFTPPHAHAQALFVLPYPDSPAAMPL